MKKKKEQATEKGYNLLFENIVKIIKQARVLAEKARKEKQDAGKGKKKKTN